MPRTRPPYPPEFRRGAIRMLRSGVEDATAARGRAGLFGADAADLAAAGRGRSGRTCRSARLGSDERARLRELERENKVLRQEREILKRAAAFFIRESDRP